MALTRVFLVDQSWRRNGAVVRLYVGPGPHYTMVAATFIDGQAVVDDDLRDRLLRLGYVRLTPPEGGGL